MANPALYRNLLIILMVTIASISVVLIAMETNIYYKQPGSESITYIDISSETDNAIGGGYVVLERQKDSPLGLEYVQFEEGQYHTFFTISEGENLRIPIYIRIPPDLESGKYYYNTKIVINGEEFISEKMYRVR